MEVSASISAFGVMFGMTLPLLTLPTAFIAALGLVLVPKLAESTALKRRGEVHRRISKAMLGTSVLMLPAMAFLVVLGPTLGSALFKEPAVGDYLAPSPWGWRSPAISRCSPVRSMGWGVSPPPPGTPCCAGR